MGDDRTQLWGVEIPEGTETELVVSFFSASDCTFLGIAVDVWDDIKEGEHRIVLSPVEALRLHAALGAALADAHTHP